MDTLKVTTANSKDDPTNVITEDIPLPPRELWADLDNSGATAAEPAAPLSALPVAVATFDADVEMSRCVELAYPLTVDGVRYARAIARRLTTAQIGEFAGLLKSTSDNSDFAGFMTGIPAPVIRAMEAGDGLAVIAMALDFLPLKLQRATGWTSASATSAPGAA